MLISGRLVWACPPVALDTGACRRDLWEAHFWTNGHLDELRFEISFRFWWREFVLTFDPFRSFTLFSLYQSQTDIFCVSDVKGSHFIHRPRIDLSISFNLFLLLCFIESFHFLSFIHLPHSLSLSAPSFLSLSVSHCVPLSPPPPPHVSWKLISVILGSWV